MEDEREYIEIENSDGKLEQIEVIAQIKSKRDNKVYLILTPDKEIGETINVSIGYIYENDDSKTIEFVKNEEEIKYINSLLNEILKDS